MKILIIGASGLVGGALYKHFGRGLDVWGADLKCNNTKYLHLDVTDAPAVSSMVKEFSPNWVFLPAYIPNVDLCEKEPTETSKTNILGMKNVADVCNMHNAGLFFYSTDYIFNGVSGPYTEKEIPNPLSVYGTQKVCVEHYILTNLKRFIIARTTWVYGWEPENKNFAARLISNLRKGECIKAPRDQFGNPTYAPHLAEMCGQLLENKFNGIINLCGSDVVSRSDHAYRIAEAFGLDKGLINIVDTKDLGQKAKRPLRGGFVTDKAHGLGLPMLGLKDSLARMRKEERSDG